MNDKKVVPIPIPNLGAGQQLPYDITEAKPEVCLKCNGELFDTVYRLGMISQFASRNITKQDIRVKYETYLCRDCGTEAGTEPKEMS